MEIRNEKRQEETETETEKGEKVAVKRYLQFSLKSPFNRVS